MECIPTYCSTEQLALCAGVVDICATDHHELHCQYQELKSSYV
jgi:hypothetical protein